MANEQNLKKIRSTEEARALQRKSAAKRSQNIKERKLLKERILERMGENDFDEMIDSLINRAKEFDKSFEVLRDTIGEKPKESVDVTVDHKDETIKELDKLFKCTRKSNGRT